MNKPNLKTYKDIYQFPFRLAKYGGWVYDNKSNFIFEFSDFLSKSEMEYILGIINGENNTIFQYYSIYNQSSQIISCNGSTLIEIRGWGNLTGIHNLSPHDAINVQDTLGYYICNKLNG